MARSRLRGVVSVSVLAMGLLLGVTASCSVGSDSPNMSRRDCVDAIAREKPVLLSEARKIVEDDKALVHVSDCASRDPGGVEGLITDRAEVVEASMRSAGDVQRTEDAECRKYLDPDECDDYFLYTPHTAEQTFIVSLPSANDSTFLIAVDPGK